MLRKKKEHAKSRVAPVRSSHAPHQMATSKELPDHTARGQVCQV